jgi:hypothetical protein
MKKSLFKGKKNMMSSVMPIAMSAGGGLAGNRLTSFLETQSFMAGKENLAPVATFAIGFIGSFFLPENLKPVAVGIATTALVELGEGVIGGIEKGNDAPAQGYMKNETLLRGEQIKDKESLIRS